MLKLAIRETLLITAVALFAHYLFPVVIGVADQPSLFWPGFLMALTFTGVYALAVLTTNRSPVKAVAVLGLLAWAGAFLPAAPDVDASFRYTFGALAVSLGAIALAARGVRPALQVFANTALTMLGIRWLLVPMVAASEILAPLAFLAGGVYTIMRVATGLMTADAPEATSQPLVRRVLPDQAVGMLEGISRRRARPYFTAPDGALDEGGVSVTVPPQEADHIIGQVAEQLAGKRIAVSKGATVPDGVEIILQPIEG